MIVKSHETANTNYEAAKSAELSVNNTYVCRFCKWVNHLFQAAQSLPPLIVPSVVFDMRN